MSDKDASPTRSTFPSVYPVAPLRGIDLHAAASEHTQLRFRLGAFLRGVIAEALEPESLLADDQCTLGRWLYGEGRVHRDDPVFQQLRKSHEEYHRAAAMIVANHYEGEVYDAAIVGFGSYFSNLSLRLSNLLTELQSSTLAR